MVQYCFASIETLHSKHGKKVLILRQRNLSKHRLLRFQCLSIMVLGKLPVPGRPTIWIIGGQGPIALAIGAGGGCLDFFSLVYHFSFFLPLSGRRPDID